MPREEHDSTFPEQPRSLVVSLRGGRRGSLAVTANLEMTSLEASSRAEF